MKFKDDFIFGGATAAYQCEGSIADYGKGKNEWDVFLEEKADLKQIQPVTFIISIQWI